MFDSLSDMMQMSFGAAVFWSVLVICLFALANRAVDIVLAFFGAVFGFIGGFITGLLSSVSEDAAEEESQPTAAPRRGRRHDA